MTIVCGCVFVWFTCGSLIMTACDGVWFLGYFDSLQAGKRPLQCLKLDQRRQGLKSRRPAGRRSEETQTLARAIVRYTVAAGSHNFSLCMFFTSLSSPSLIFCSECWMAQLKVCEVLSDSDKKKKKRHLVFVPSFGCLLGFKAGVCVCAHSQRCTSPSQCKHSAMWKL